MKSLMGFLLIAGSIIGGLYIGVWVLFVGGIVDIINGIKLDFDAIRIAVGLLKFFASGFCGWLFFLVFFRIGIELLD